MFTKEQKREWHREWRKKNPEKERLYWKRTYKKNREKILEHKRKRYKEHLEIRKLYYEKNKVKINQKNKEYAKNNREKVNAKHNKWYHKHKKYVSERHSEYRKNNLEKSKWWALKSRYGITKEDYIKIFNEQDEKCAICGSDNPKYSGHTSLYVDHDHNTNKIRGLLCKTCNLLLGNSEENIEILQNAIEYLKKYSLSEL